LSIVRRNFTGVPSNPGLLLSQDRHPCVGFLFRCYSDPYLGRALDNLRRGGEIIPDPLLSHLSSVGWQHINLTGDYLWDADSHLAPDGFRQLRFSAAMTPHAA
jgi:hypothetical protein